MYPTGVTSVEKRAVLEATMQAGASENIFDRRASSSSSWSRFGILQAAAGSMVVDIGGGTTDIAVLSLGGVVVDAPCGLAAMLLTKLLSGMVKRHS